MKSFNLYREQVDCITNWFKSWTECEQTVALYSLVKRVSETQAKFVCQVLEQKLNSCPELELLEEEANDPEYVLALSQENVHFALTQMTSHLPLLRCGNLSAKSEYWRLLPTVLDTERYIDEGKELLSYALIHPAVNAEERSWLAHLQQEFLTRIVSTKLSQNGDDGYTNNWQNEKIDVKPVNCPHEKSCVNTGGKTTTVASSGWETFSPTPSSSVMTYSNVDQICRPHAPLQSAASAPSPYQHTSLEKPSPTLAPWHRLTTQSHVPLGQSLSPQPTHSYVHKANIWNQVADISTIAPADHTIPCTAWTTPPTNTLLHSTLSAPNVKVTPPLQQTTSTSAPSSGHQALRRTISVTPPGYAPLPPSLTHPPLSERLSYPSQSEHKPVSPQSSAASSSSGSDTHTSDMCPTNSFLERGSGMRDVPTWLRHLRLHKYAHLFQTMTYEEMLDITEDWLLAQNVTAGASNKILLSIKRLRGRQNMLKMLEKQLGEGSPIPVMLDTMKVMLDMPLKQFSPTPSPTAAPDDPPSPQSPTPPSVETVELMEGDVPGQFTRLLLKVTTQLLVGEPNPKSFQMCRQLITKCINHEAFTEKQKKTLESRKNALEACHSHMVRFRACNRNTALNPRSFSGGAPRAFSGGGAVRRGGQNQNWSPGTGGSWLAGNPPPQSSPAGVQWSFGSKRAVLGGTTSSHTPLSRCHTNPIVVTQSDGKQALSRAQSAPLNSKPPLTRANVPGSADIRGNESDYNAQLESLCISMTEHALGGPDGVDVNASRTSPNSQSQTPALSTDHTAAQWYC